MKYILDNKCIIIMPKQVTPTPTPTIEILSTPTPTPTRTSTPTPQATSTPTSTQTPTKTSTITPTPSQTPTKTPTNTLTRTQTPSVTRTNFCYYQDSLAETCSDFYLSAEDGGWQDTNVLFNVNDNMYISAYGCALSGDNSDAVNMIQNGGFEYTSVPTTISPGSWGTLYPFDSGLLQGWTIISGSVDLKQGGGANYVNAVKGDRVLDLNGDGPGTIQQSITTIPGVTYQVSFFITPNIGVITEPGQPFDPWWLVGETISMAVYAIGATTSSMNVSRKVSIQPSSYQWEKINWQFVANSNSTIIRFAGTSPGPGGMFIDDIVVLPVSQVINSTTVGPEGIESVNSDSQYMKIQGRFNNNGLYSSIFDIGKLYDSPAISDGILELRIYTLTPSSNAGGYCVCIKKNYYDRHCLASNFPDVTPTPTTTVSVSPTPSKTPATTPTSSNTPTMPQQSPTTTKTLTPTPSITPTTYFTLLGNKIYGTTGDFLNIINISDDATILAVSSSNTNNDIAKIYSWDSTDWVIKGSSIPRDSIYNVTRKSSLSKDGSTIAVGSASLSLLKSSAIVYAWDGSDWAQKGNRIIGTVDNTYSYISTALNYDGTKLILGWQYSGSYGKIGVFSWDGSAWDQYGNLFDMTEGTGGGVNVAINNDGDIIAVANDSFPGSIGIYYLDKTYYYWKLMGNYISTGWGPARFSLSMSGDGETIVFGAISTGGGLAEVYTWEANDWIKKGASFYTTGSSPSVALSNNGNVLAIGDSTSVRVYEWNGTDWVIQRYIAGQGGQFIDLNSSGSIIAFGDPLFNTNEGRVTVLEALE